MTLRDLLHAMDDLNRFARSSTAKWMGHRFVPMLYEAKKVVLADAIARGLAKLYRNNVTVKCRTCGGSGRYHGWNYSVGSFEEDCRACRGSGKVLLHFVESVISCGDFNCTWHTPTVHWFDMGPVLNGISEVRATDWQPNQPGAELPVERLAECLNLIETHCAGRMRYYHDVQYTLRLPDLDACGVCGCPADAKLGTMLINRMGCRWTAPACLMCFGPWCREYWISGKDGRFNSYLPSITEKFSDHPLMQAHGGDGHLHAWIERRRVSAAV